jgi:hypothetical protein
MDVPPTMMAKTKPLRNTKMVVMTKKLSWTCQGVYRARMGTIVGLVFAWLLLGNLESRSNTKVLAPVYSNYSDHSSAHSLYQQAKLKTQR